MADRHQVNRERLETESLIVGYAMSRLDREYLVCFELDSWSDAFIQASKALCKPSTTFKNLRDEFDPFHSNSRRGWHQRPIRQNRQRILDELTDVSDEALVELVRGVLDGRSADTAEAVDALAVRTRVPQNVAERLLTGRRAEEFFFQNSLSLVGIDQRHIIDYRNAACGFDFGSQLNTGLAVEVKGMKQSVGAIQFTDREWIEAKLRGDNYLLVVVGNLASSPEAKLIINPHAQLYVSCNYQRTVSAVWRSNIKL